MESPLQTQRWVHPDWPWRATGSASSHHFDCAEDFGDWQSKWTDEPWVFSAMNSVQSRNRTLLEFQPGDLGIWAGWISLRIFKQFIFNIRGGLFFLKRFSVKVWDFTVTRKRSPGAAKLMRLEKKWWMNPPRFAIDLHKKPQWGSTFYIHYINVYHV